MMSWQYFALGSAFFAAWTAIFGKLGVVGLNSNLATLIRTGIVFCVSAAVVSLRHEWARPAQWPVKGVLFLVLSGIATGLSWLCYYRALQIGPASRVAPLDKLSVVGVVMFSVLFLGEPLTWKLVLGVLFMVSGSILMIG